MYVFPLEKKVVTINNSKTDFLPSYEHASEIPVYPHPGAFAAVRKHHVHEGVDLYCDPGDPISCIGVGTVENISIFTGPRAGSPWWKETWAVTIRHKDFVAVYGELVPFGWNIPKGYPVGPGDLLGVATPVLDKDKGRPMTMLHFEIYSPEMQGIVEWNPFTDKPLYLLDPTFLLLNIARDQNLLKGV